MYDLPMNKNSQIDRDRLYEQALKVANTGNVKLTENLLERAGSYSPISDSQQEKIDEALAKAWAV